MNRRFVFLSLEYINASEKSGALVRYQHIRDGLYAVIGLVVLLFSSLLTGCSTSAPPSSNHTSSRATQSAQYSGPINHPVSTTGCGRALSFASGTSTTVTIPSNPAVSRGSHTRTYMVHMPASYDMSRSYAVVLSFHGYGGNAAGMDHSSGFSQLADRQGFIAVYPQGLLDGDGGKPFWASVGPIDDGIDDALFVSDVLNELQKDFCIDAHRIYATGFSNGGGMTGFLACRLAGRIAAFAPISGNFYALPGGCHPGRPVPILDFHGTADGTLPYMGISVSKNPVWPLPPIPQWLQEWATRDGCTHGPAIFLRQSNVTGEQWSGCQENAAVVHYRIEGGGHTGPPFIDGQSSAAIMWQFFKAHPLSEV